MSNKSWNILSDRVVDKERVLDLSGKLGISDLTAQLLINRGIVDSDDADRFFKFTDTVFHDPYLLYDMEKAVARIEKALSQKEKIVIYGDYDVDGITSSALIFKYLKSRGCSDISFYIPERVDEGYGLNNDALDRFSGEKANLIITVDTGVTAFNE